MLLYAIIPVATIILGGTIALVFKPSAAIYSIILHFSAGVVSSVVAVELLPDIVKIHDPLRITIGFLMGIIVMLAIMYYTGKLERKQERKDKPGLPTGLLLAVGIDIAIDGFLLGIGFAAGIKEGMLLSFALATENLTLSLSTATSLGKANIPFKKSMLIVITLAIIFLITAIIGDTLLHNLSDKPMEIALSFGLAALLFLVTEELLVKAHEQKDTIWFTAPFFMGFLLFLILGVIT